ncbi:MAG: amidase family protein [Thermoleophilia bacterium]
MSPEQAAAARDALGRARAAARDAVTAARVELVAGPTTPIPPPPLGEPDPTRVAGRNTRVFNGLGWPSLSLPCGRADGLPVGLMLSAPAGRDRELLAATLAVEAAVAG